MFDDGAIAPQDAEPVAVADVPVVEAAAEAAPAEAAAGTDALLSMFQEAEAASEDRSVVLDLAGDVELADLLEDLQTRKAAMGIVAA